jgi:predicted anti-sigma-YlaC factor YlaD
MDGEISTERKKTIQIHLQECEACQEVLKTMNRAWDMLDELSVPESAPYFYTRLKARMEAEKPEKGQKWIESILIPASAVVAIILGIIVGSIVGSNGNQQAEAAVVEEEFIASYLDSFEDLPSVSLAEVYLDMSSQER